MTKVTGKRAALALKTALADVGLPRTSTYTGGAIAGWIEPNRFGSTGFSIREGRDGSLDWHLVLSGKPHMDYREWVEPEADHEGSDSRELHEPTNPEVVVPRIREAFETIGLVARDIRYSGCSMHWDDDVEFEVVTDRPDWLAHSDPREKPVFPASGVHALVPLDFTARVSRRMTIAGYRNGVEGVFLPRESIQAIIDRLAEENHDLTSWSGAEVSIGRDGVLTLRHPQPARMPEFVFRFPVRTIADTWRSDIEVWALPRNWIQLAEDLRFDHPVWIGDDLVEGDEVAPFLDEQYGFEAPFIVPPDRAARFGPR